MKAKKKKVINQIVRWQIHGDKEVTIITSSIGMCFAFEALSGSCSSSFLRVFSLSLSIFCFSHTLTHSFTISLALSLYFCTVEYCACTKSIVSKIERKTPPSRASSYKK